MGYPPAKDACIGSSLLSLLLKTHAAEGTCDGTRFEVRTLGAPGTTTYPLTVL
jgi:hypothetical protein